MRIINTVLAPTPIGPYSQAIEHENLIYLSGQIGINPLDSSISQDIKIQTKQVFDNIQNILKEANSSLENVIKVEIFLKNISDFAIVNEIYASLFGSHKPARQTIGGLDLPKGALIEISCISFKNPNE